MLSITLGLDQLNHKILINHLNSNSAATWRVQRQVKLKHTRISYTVLIVLLLLLLYNSLSLWRRQKQHLRGIFCCQRARRGVDCDHSSRFSEWGVAYFAEMLLAREAARTHNAAHGAKKTAGRFDLSPGPLDKLLGNHLHAARLEFRSPPAPKGRFVRADLNISRY